MLYIFYDGDLNAVKGPPPTLLAISSHSFLAQFLAFSPSPLLFDQSPTLQLFSYYRSSFSTCPVFQNLNSHLDRLVFITSRQGSTGIGQRKRYKQLGSTWLTTQGWGVKQFPYRRSSRPLILSTSRIGFYTKETRRKKAWTHLCTLSGRTRLLFPSTALKRCLVSPATRDEFVQQVLQAKKITDSTMDWLHTAINPTTRSEVPSSNCPDSVSKSDNRSNTISEESSEDGDLSLERPDLCYGNNTGSDKGICHHHKALPALAAGVYAILLLYLNYAYQHFKIIAAAYYIIININFAILLIIKILNIKYKHYILFCFFSN